MRRQKSQLKQMINRAAAEGQHGNRAPNPVRHYAPGQQIQNRIDSLNQQNQHQYQRFANQDGSFVYDGTNVYPEHQSPAGHGGNMHELAQIRNALGELSNRLAETQQAPAGYAPVNSDAYGNQVSAQEFDEALAEIHNSIASMIEQLPDRNQFENLQASIASVVQAGPQGHAELSRVVEEGNKFVTKQMEEMRTSVTTSVAQAAGFSKTARDNAQEFKTFAKQLKQSVDAQQKNLQSQLNSLQQQLAKSNETKIDSNFLQSSHAEMMEQMKGIRKQLDTGLKDAGAGGSNEALEAIELRLEDVNRAMVALSQNNSGSDQLERLEARLIDLAKSAQEASNAAPAESVRPALDAINAAVQGLSTKVNSLTQASGASSSTDIVKRLDTLGERMENMLAASGSTGETGSADPALIDRLDTIVERVGNAAPDVAVINTLGNQISEISSRFEAAHAELLSTNDHERKALHQQLQGIADAVQGIGGSDANTDQNAQLVILENNINHLAEQLSGISNTSVDLNPLSQKLESIEEQVASSRDIAIELAAKAAEDAVHNAVQHMADKLPTDDTGSKHADLLTNLTKEIKVIQENTANNQQGNREAFEEVTRSLSDMAERLAEIEKGGQAIAPGAPAAKISEPATAQLPDSEEMAAKLSAIATQSSENEPENGARSDFTNPVGKALFDEAAKAEQARAMEAEASADSLDAYEKRELGAFSLETGEVQAAETKPLQSLSEEQTPVLDPTDVAHEPAMHAELDAPLEPGTSGPDLAAMVRHANERRKSIEADNAETSSTDFIAAARRAAQAAAEQANAAQLEADEHERKPSGGLLASILGKRKKAIVLTIAAALLAAAVVPIAGKMLNNGGMANLANFSAVSEVVESWTGSSEPTPQTAAADEQSSQTEGQQTEVIKQDQSSIRTIETSPQPTAGETQPRQADQDTLGFQQDNQVKPAGPEIVAAPTLDNTTLAGYASEVNVGNEALKVAVGQGDPAAVFEVGRRYTDGVGTSKDLAQAAKWYTRAADMNYAPAQYMIGNFLEKGLGVEKDMRQAVGWYEKAANNGNVIAMHNLAVLYATPNAIAEKPDNVMAFSWFKQAAEHGVRDSQVNLGIFYTKGVGTAVNLIEAYKWFDVAAKAGDKDAESKREIVAQALRPDQLDSAKSISEGWKSIEISSAANASSPKREWLTSGASNQSASITNPVARVQTMLSKLGYDVGTIDGVMGDKTRQAIAQFQSRSDLPINGKISKDFLRKLEAKAI